MTEKMIGTCVMCDNEATGVILDEVCIDYLDTCDDCYKEVFVNVANSGASVFYEWAVEMYGEEKAFGLTRDIFGNSALEQVGYSEVASAKDEEMVTMFTYGILSYPDNIKHEGGVNIVEHSTVKGHKMYLYNNSFPITKLTNNDNDVIYGTLFEIPLSYVLGYYDHVESYNPNRPAYNNMYNRIEVDVTKPDGETVKAQMYLANDRMFITDLVDYNLIPTGKFSERHLARSFGKSKWNRKG